MVRLGLALYLTLAATAGPWLCCCTSTRLAAFLTAPHCPAAVKSTPHRSACCAKRSRGQPAVTPAPGQPSAPVPPVCPCQERRSQTAALTLSAGDGTAHSEATIKAPGNTLIIPAMSGLSLHDPLFLARDTSPPSFLSARLLLRTHHLLRC